MEVKQRLKGDVLVADHTGLWVTMASGYESSKDAMSDAKSAVHGDNQGEWAWNTKGVKSYKRCNFHTDCPVLLRAVRNPDGQSWRQEVLNVTHALAPKEYRHARSVFTFEQAAQVKDGVERGLKPTKIRNEDELKAIAAGCTEKRDGGGLACAHALHKKNMRRYSTIHNDTFTIRMCL